MSGSARGVSSAMLKSSCGLRSREREASPEVWRRMSSSPGDRFIRSVRFPVLCLATTLRFSLRTVCEALENITARVGEAFSLISIFDTDGFQRDLCEDGLVRGYIHAGESANEPVALFALVEDKEKSARFAFLVGCYIFGADDDDRITSFSLVRVELEIQQIRFAEVMVDAA